MQLWTGFLCNASQYLTNALLVFADTMSEVISLDDYWMGRFKQYPASAEIIFNATVLLDRVNALEKRYGTELKLSSGYRPPEINKQIGGAPNSCHLTGEAIDIRDPHGEFAEWLLENLIVLEALDLFMESPSSTKAAPHVHLQSRKPPSGKRVFIA